MFRWFARLFDYTRRLEQDLAVEKVRLQREEASSSLEIELLRKHHADEVAFLRLELQDAKKERQFLQDRFLYLNRIPPIYESSPREVEARELAGNSNSTPRTQMGPRRTATQKGTERHEELRAQVDLEVKDFVQQEKAKTEAAR